MQRDFNVDAWPAGRAVRKAAHAGWITLTAVLLLVLPAAAQEPTRPLPEDSSVITVGGVVVNVLRPATTPGGASAVMVQLDSASVEPVPTLEQILRSMPLIQIRENSRGQAQPALRGSEERQIAILVDGVPLTLGWDHRTDVSLIPMTAAQGVTLLRGLPSMLYGPNVLAGVVKVDVARGPFAMQDPIPLQLSAGVDHLGGSTFGVTGGAPVDLDGGGLQLRAGAGLRDRPEAALPRGVAPLAAAEEDRLLNSDAQDANGFVALRYLADGGAWASLSAFGNRVERGVPPELHVSEPRLWRYPESSQVLTAVSAGTGQRATPLGEGDLEASVGVNLGEERIDEYASLAYDEVVGGETSDDRTVTLRLLGEHTLGATADLRLAATYADVHHDELIDGEVGNTYRQRLWSIGSELEWRPPTFGGLTGTRLSAGFAFDGADTPETGGRAPLGRLSAWGGRLGATTVARGGQVLLHAGVSRRARFPALRELYSTGLGRFAPNPDLEPEYLTAIEGGATAQLGGIELQAVTFHQRITGALARVSVEVDGESKLQRVNHGEVRSTGLELLGGWGWRDFSVSGDITLQNVDVIDPTATEQAAHVEYEPAIAGGLEVAGPLALEVRGTARVDVRGRQWCVDPDVAGGYDEIDPSALVGLELQRPWELRPNGMLSRLSTVVSLDNATNAAIYDQCGLPRPGRTLRLQVRVW